MAITHRTIQKKILIIQITTVVGSSPPRDWTRVSCIAGRFFSTEPSGKPVALSYLGANNNVLQYPWILWWSSGYDSVLSLPRAQVRFQVRELRSRKLWKKRKKVKLLSHIRLFVTPWTVADQAPPPMGFSRQEYWSRLPFPSPGDLPDPGIEPRSSALQADALTSEPPGKPICDLRRV